MLNSAVSKILIYKQVSAKIAHYLPLRFKVQKQGAKIAPKMRG